MIGSEVTFSISSARELVRDLPPLDTGLGGHVEAPGEGVRVEKEQVRAAGGSAGREAEVGERVVSVASPFRALGKALQKAGHGRETELAEPLGGLDAPPDKAVWVFADGR